MGFYTAQSGAKGHCGRPIKRPSVPHYGGSSMRVPEIARAGGGGYNQPGPRLPSPPPALRLGGGQPNLDRDRPKSGGGTPGYVQRPSNVPTDTGIALRMPRAADLPSDNGGGIVRMPPPPAKQDGGKPGRPKQPSVELVPFTTPLVPDPQTQNLNPLPRPRCEDPRLAGTELCAGTVVVSPSCRDLITNFLKDNPSAVPTDILAMLGTGGQWELCALEIRAALAPAGTKASSGMYGRSGGMPNYWRASGYGYRPSGITPAEQALFDSYADAEDATSDREFGGGATYRLVDPSNPSNVVQGNATAADWARGSTPPPVPITPPVDYGRLIAGIGSAVGGVFQGVNTAIANSQQSRFRELELQYAQERNAAELALRRLAIENQNAIATLSAQGTPAASAAASQLANDNAALQVRIAALTADSEKMSTGTTVALVVGGVAIAGVLAYVVLKK